VKYRAVLVDDEPLALARVRRLLESHTDVVEVVGEANNGFDAIELIHRTRPDVLFLDVQMPELTGFDVLERLDYTPLVIFATAHDQYALRAFDVHSVDYLLKPIDPRRLAIAIEKLLRLSDTRADDLRQRIAEVLQSLQGSHTRRLQVKLGDRIKLIPVSEIAFFLAGDKYVEVFTRDRSSLITKSLSRLERELPPDEFVRVHRSAIVNLAFVDEITRGFGGAYEVRMKNAAKTTLPVSRRYKSRLNLG
jgi:two-component system LytT family response regulator